MCPVSYKVVHYSEKQKMKLAGILRMAEMETTTNLDFMGHGHDLHAYASCYRLYGLR